MKLSYKIKKRHFVQIFFGIILVLFFVRLAFPSIRHQSEPKTELSHVKTTQSKIEKGEKKVVETIKKIGIIHKSSSKGKTTLSGKHLLNFDLMKPVHDWKKHKIYSVASYRNSFPDINDVQIATAQKLGVEPVANRTDAECHKDKLVFIGISPYYNVKKLYSSIPYLVPRAQLLLTKIARNFLDSQYVKKVLPSKLIVTSVTRTKEDIAHLQRHNPNATSNSCHCYGTTFDISYNKYQAVQHPDSALVRQTRNDTLKYILSEVLNDLRQEGLCYVKYEVKQGCYHITVR